MKIADWQLPEIDSVWQYGDTVVFVKARTSRGIAVATNGNQMWFPTEHWIYLVESGEMKPIYKRNN